MGTDIDSGIRTDKCLFDAWLINAKIINTSWIAKRIITTVITVLLQIFSHFIEYSVPVYDDGRKWQESTIYDIHTVESLFPHIMHWKLK